MDHQNTVNESVQTVEEGGLSRRQLLAGGAGLAGLIAGVGMVGRTSTADAASAGAGVSTAASGGFDMFLKITDHNGQPIYGESKDTQHPREIEVLAWSWGESNSSTPRTGGAGKANVQDFSFTKYIDVSTPHLLMASLSGEHLTSVVFTVRQAGDKANLLVFTLSDVIVSSISTGGSGGEDRLTENITLNFAKLKLEYDGPGVLKKPITMTWNVSTNSPT